MPSNRSRSSEYVRLIVTTKGDKQKKRERVEGRCVECQRKSNYLVCRHCKENWRDKVRKLFSEGVKPLSIAVRIGKSWQDVVLSLIEDEIIEDDGQYELESRPRKWEAKMKKDRKKKSKT